MLSQINNEMVQVAVRCRPMSQKEISNSYSSVVKIEPSRNTVEIFDPKQDGTPYPKAFKFDATFDGEASQSEVHERMVQTLVNAVLNGYNGTVFAYGQSGSGKTYTMEGTASDSASGILPRTTQDIFEHISRSHNIQYLIRVSFIEIYRDEIKDLLDRKSGKKYEIRESKNSGMYVKDVTLYVCKSKKEMDAIIEAGRRNRMVASTDINEKSSRSHAIVTITVEMKDLSGPLEGRVRVGKLNLVDLAGSERQNKTNAQGDRLKEANTINLSLSALGNVISALSESKNHHVPYRDSKLTRILKDSLGGNSKTVMIANIGPASYNYEESLNTLRYASRAKHIRNEPRVNEDPVDTLIRRYQEEIKRLKLRLEERIVDKKCSNTKKRDIDYSLKSQSMTQVSHTMLGKKDIADSQIHRNAEKQEDEVVNELRKRIDLMESKLLIGRENILEHTKEQKRSLQNNTQEINKIKERERGINEIIVKEKDVTDEIIEDFLNLEQEVQVKKKNLIQIYLKLQAINQDIKDVKDEFNRDRRELEISQHEILKEIKLKLYIVENFIPKKHCRQIYPRMYYDQNIDCWQIKTNFELREIVCKPKNIRCKDWNLTFFSSQLQRTRKKIRHNQKKGNILLAHKYKRENILEFDLIWFPSTVKFCQPTKLTPVLNKMFRDALQLEEDIDIDAKKCSLNIFSNINSSRKSLESVVKQNCNKNSQKTQSAVNLPYYPTARGLVPK